MLSASRSDAAAARAASRTTPGLAAPVTTHTIGVKLNWPYGKVDDAWVQRWWMQLAAEKGEQVPDGGGKGAEWSSAGDNGVGGDGRIGVGR